MEGKITAIKAQKKNKNRVSVFIDGEYSFSLDMVTALKLKTGTDLKEEDINDLLKKDSPRKAYSDGLYFLSFRSRTLSETRKYLIDKGYSEDLTGGTLEKLIDLGFVDDANYARQFVESKTRSNPKGSFALKYELESRGISKDHIQNALDEYDEFRAAKETVEKKFYKWQKLPVDKIKNKIYTFLSTRGFSYDITKDVTEEIISERL